MANKSRGQNIRGSAFASWCPASSCAIKTSAFDRSFLFEALPVLSKCLKCPSRTGGIAVIRVCVDIRSSHCQFLIGCPPNPCMNTMLTETISSSSSDGIDGEIYLLNECAVALLRLIEHMKAHGADPVLRRTHRSESWIIIPASSVDRSPIPRYYRRRTEVH